MRMIIWIQEVTSLPLNKGGLRGIYNTKESLYIQRSNLPQPLFAKEGSISSSSQTPVWELSQEALASRRIHEAGAWERDKVTSLPLNRGGLRGIEGDL